MIPLKDENPSRSFPLITLGLILVNIGVYIYQLLQPEILLSQFIQTFGMTPAALLLQMPEQPSSFPRVLTLVTSQFLHGGMLHLAGNMLYLWIFGNNIEDVLGKMRFLLFYLFCGALAALAHLVLHPFSEIPMIGASGAIAGVLGAYLITFPGARVLMLVFFLVVRIRAFWVLGFWFLMQLFYAGSVEGQGGTNVAYIAHVGGFIAGIWLIKKLRPGARVRRY
ncbi:MAG: rhomboid family intramembrane serine protease [bacterium]